MKSNLEQELQRQLKQEIPIPETVKQKVQFSYEEIQQGHLTQEPATPHSRLWIKRTAAAVSSVAAAFFLCMILFLANPVLAEKLPVVGSLFTLLQDHVSFFGNFSDYAVSLDTEDDSLSDGKDAGSVYSQTADGLTVTLSEVYTDSQAVYLTVLMENEEAFPDTLIDQGGRPVLSLYTEETYDFLPEEFGSDLYNLEGQFLDDYTYTCILRLDLADFHSAAEIPDNFHLDLKIQQIVGDLADPQVWDSGYTEEELTAMSDEEWKEVMSQMPEEYSMHPNSFQHYWFDGPWEFSLDLTADHSRTQTIEINEIGENGAGLESVILSPYELTVYDTYAEGVNPGDYFCVALDANGNRLPYNDSSGQTNHYAVQDRDISTVDIYILDYVEYMDELKGEERYNNNENKPEEEKWSTLLDEHCFYHTTLNLTPIE